MSKISDAQVVDESDKIDFLDSDFSDITSGKQSTFKGDIPEGDTEKKSNSNSTAPESVQTEEKTDDFFSAFDYEDLSDFGIEIVDVAFSTGLKMFAGTKNTKEFELPQTKKNKLSKMLSKIMAKHQVGVSLEALFFITLVMCYYEPVKRAIELKQEKKNSKNHTVNFTKSSSTVANDEDILEAEKISDNDSQEAEYIVRKSGRPRKKSA